MNIIEQWYFTVEWWFDNYDSSFWVFYPALGLKYHFLLIIQGLTAKTSNNGAETKRAFKDLKKKVWSWRDPVNAAISKLIAGMLICGSERRGLYLQVVLWNLNEPRNYSVSCKKLENFSVLNFICFWERVGNFK